MPTPIPSGQTAVTTQFALGVTNTALNITVNDAKTSVVEAAPTKPPPTTTLQDFDIVNETTGKVYQSAGEPYTGPVAGIDHDIIMITTDNINVTALTANVFIKSGSGEDSLNVAGANGNNVLDGGTGSNFLVGGAGNDTFFLDDRNPPGALWSTLVNFHSGDNATVWGLTAADFQVQTLDNQGAAGFTGLTFNFTQAGQPTASLTLTGFSSADLSNGRLSLSYGRTDDLPGLPGSNYLSIHGG